MADAKSQEFEKVLSQSATDVASFERHEKSVIERIQHVLHSNPAGVPLIVLVLSLALFGILLGGKFFSAFTLTLILQQVAIVGIVGAAQTLVILTAGIDLSVGAIMVLSSVVMGQFTFRYGIPAPISVLCGFATGAIIGFINGFLVARIKLPPFIVTLGMWQIVLATNFLYSRNETIRSQDIEANAPLLQLFGTQLRIGGAVFTWGVIIMVLLVLVLNYVLNHTAWGRHVYAIGDDPDAAELSGVQVNRTLISVYMLSGLICALAGWVLIGRIGSVSPTAGAVRQHREHHRRGDRGHLALRRARLDPRHDLRGADRRRLRARPAAARHRSAMDLPADRPPHHRRGRHRPVDQKGCGVITMAEPILTARGIVKRYGRVTALDHADFDLLPTEILAVIGDNGAGKSSLIKAISGAVTPDEGEIRLEGNVIHFTSPMQAREAGIETVYQNLALSPALSIADNMFMGREMRVPGFWGEWLRKLDRKAMEKFARQKLSELGLLTIQNINQAVETLSGGQRQGVAVARAAAFGSKVVILDEPTAALGVKESRKVLDLIQDVRARGMPIVLISHNMPHVFEVSDRIHIHRLGRRLCVINPKDYTMSDAVAFMTGAKQPPEEAMAA